MEIYSDITSVDGDITIIGTSEGTGEINNGVYFSGDGTVNVASTGDGNITITGTGSDNGSRNNAGYADFHASPWMEISIL